MSCDKTTERQTGADHTGRCLHAGLRRRDIVAQEAVPPVRPTLKGAGRVTDVVRPHGRCAGGQQGWCLGRPGIRRGHEDQLVHPRPHSESSRGSSE